MYRLANVEVEKVLVTDPNNIHARNRKAVIFIHEDPERAVQFIQETFQIERAESQQLERFYVRTKQVEIAQLLGRFELCRQLKEGIAQDYNHMFKLPKAVWQPLTRLELYENLAFAFEAAGEYGKALAEYGNLLDEMNRIDPVYRKDVHVKHGPKIEMGQSRCFYRLGRYEPAILAVADLMARRRTFPGVHKLVALSLFALAEQRGDTNDGSTVCGLSPTLAGAIEVMYKGFVYEIPYDHLHKANRVILQELCDQMAASKGIPNTSAVDGAGSSQEDTSSTSARQSDGMDNALLTTQEEAGKTKEAVESTHESKSTTTTRRGTRGKKDRTKKRKKVMLAQSGDRTTRNHFKTVMHVNSK